MTDATSTTYGQGFTSLRRAWNAMSNWAVFGGDTSPSELALEVPDDAEEVDLKRHATRCALRYRSLKDGLKGQSDRLKRIELIVLVVGIWIIATSPQFHDILRSLLGL